jgi:predicted exporter
MSLGFGVLMLSQVPANAQLGMLLVLGLVNCFVVSLLLLPTLLQWWPLNHSDDVRLTHLNKNAGALKYPSREKNCP